MQTGPTTVDDDGPQRLALLASALAGRTVAVAAGADRRTGVDGRHHGLRRCGGACRAPTRIGDRSGVAACLRRPRAGRPAETRSPSLPRQEVPRRRGPPRAGRQRRVVAVLRAIGHRPRPGHARRLARGVAGGCRQRRRRRSARQFRCAEASHPARYACDCRADRRRSGAQSAPRSVEESGRTRRRCRRRRRRRHGSLLQPRRWRRRDRQAVAAHAEQGQAAQRQWTTWR